MTTRLAPQRQFIISTRSAIVDATSPPEDLAEEQLTVEVESASAANTSDSPAPTEEFEFCTEDGVVVAATLEDVMTQVRLRGVCFNRSNDFPNEWLAHLLFPLRTASSCRRN